MDQQELGEKLRSLGQLDTDAVAVYDIALERASDDEVRTSFERFKGEHQYHASQLTDIIERITGTRPTFEVDLLGHVADWVTTIRSRIGMSGALHAMKTAETYHNRRYGEATSWEVDDPDVAGTLHRFHEDEKRHLAFIESELSKYRSNTADV